MNKPTISIIIPVYNVENYIEHCVHSLMKQTMTDDIEFIFINDCTPDKSVDLLNMVLYEYPHRKGQVQIINNESNLGVSETRKIGVTLAQGKYIGWCDSDDWVEPDMYEKMLSIAEAENKDIVTCSYIKEIGGGKIEVHEPIQCAKPEECITNFYKGYYLPGSLWQNIYRREIIDYAINKVQKTSYGEDMYANFLAFAKASSIGYVSKHLYHYNALNEGSLLHNIDYSKDAWLSQKKNLIIIAHELFSDGGYELYHVAVNAYKFKMKQMFHRSFCNILEFYYSFPECYRDVNKYLFTPANARLKTWLVYNIFPLFWYYNRKI